MTVTTTTTTITGTNNPFTLAAGNTIDISANLSGNFNEAIYTNYSPSNATFVGGPTIVIDGVVLDTANPNGNSDEYAIQSRSAAEATIVNDGLIKSTEMVAIGVNNGVVVNDFGSTIAGTGGIVIGYGSLPSTVINEGLITGSSRAGIGVLTTGANLGFVDNFSTGVIVGGSSGNAIDESGIYLRAGTVTNAGTISKGGTSGYSVDFASSLGHDTLILDPGQVLNGEATASGTGNYIILGGTGYGTLSNPDNYHGFTLISVAHGSDWQIGTASQAVSVPGVGTINVGGTLDVLGSITGTDFNMTDSSGLVDYIQPLSSTALGNDLGRITDFGPGNSFIVAPAVLTIDNGDSIVTSYDSVTGVYTFVDQTRFEQGENDSYFDIRVFGTNSPNNLTADNLTYSLGPNGVTVSEVPCFGAGTQLLTPDGMIAVENLAEGDEVLSARTGDARKIVWAGSRRIDVARHPRPEKIMPVRVRAGALAHGLPERDLILSPDHALLLDGHLVEAKTLVNGATILWDKSRRSVTYYHIELAEHDVVLAEGVPAETYLESGKRDMFEGAAVQLHPDFAADRGERSCAPLLLEGPTLMAIRDKLLKRALDLGFELTGEIDLAVKAGNRVLAPSGRVGNHLWFALPAGCANVTLLSATGVPAETGADPADRRVLGAAITGLALTDENGRRTIDLGDPAHTGFHDAEPSHRWTNGAATVALPDYAGQAILDVTLTGQAVRWRIAAASRVA